MKTLTFISFVRLLITCASIAYAMHEGQRVADMLNEVARAIR